MRTEQEMLESILIFAKNDERIRAVYLFGSRANPDTVKDIYQDYDISFAVTETESFQADQSWTNAFGDTALLAESERNRLIYFGSKDMSALSRRCVFNFLFNDNNCLDLVIEIKEEAIKNFAICRPNTVLLDKDGLLPGMAAPADEKHEGVKPDEAVFRVCCSNFWWFMFYPVKGIARGNIPSAMVSYNSFTRTLLNRMIEWYIGVQTHFSVPIGRNEKFYKNFLPQNLYDLYAKTYTGSSHWDVMLVTCELFNKLALAVGSYFNFTYNQQEEDKIMNYMRKVKDGCLS